MVVELGVPTVALIFLVLFGIWPLFGEELFYRGLLFGGFRQKWSFWPAATFAGFFFAIRHSVQILPFWSGSPVDFPWIVFLAAAFHPFIGGYLYSWVYERTQNLAIGMVLHLINNLSAWLVLVFFFAQ